MTECLPMELTSLESVKWAVWLFYSRLTSCNLTPLPLDPNHKEFRHGVVFNSVV